jgi:SAM-dependent methyltransferase
MRRVGMLRAPEFYRLRPSGPGNVVDLGCGNAKYPGALGVDKVEGEDVDIVADLDHIPWPLDDETADQILCQDVIEHLEDPLAALGEMHRIGRPGARVHLRTPHFSSVLAYSDPTHRHVFSALAIRTIAEPLYERGPQGRFRLIQVTLDFWDPLRWVFVNRLANRFQGTYESLFAFRLPAMNLRAELEVLK